MELQEGYIKKSFWSFILNGYTILRPKQWIKNIFVFTGLLFSDKLFELNAIITSIYAFITFSAVSSCIYILNDIVDVEKDKLHPKKKYRPIPSGMITKAQAKILLITLLLISFTFSYFILGYEYTLICFAYLFINVLYSFKLKHIPIIDVMVISFGFLLRTLSGCIVLHTFISPWLLVVIFQLCLFLGINKRKSELIVLDDKAKEHRKILGEYSIEMVNSMLAVVTPSAIIAYCLYTYSEGKSIMIFTLLFIIYGFLRYQYLIHKKLLKDDTETILLGDLSMIINGFLWVITTIIIEYYIY